MAKTKTAMLSAIAKEFFLMLIGIGIAAESVEDLGAALAQFELIP